MPLQDPLPHKVALLPNLIVSQMLHQIKCTTFLAVPPQESIHNRGGAAA